MTKYSHILIAEDELRIRRSLKFILENAGYHVSSAMNGADALQTILSEKVAENPVEMLVLDLDMPTMDGIELLEELEQRQIDMPVLIITGYADRMPINELMASGQCRDFMVKPVNPDELLQYVCRLFAAQHQDVTLVPK